MAQSIPFSFMSPGALPLIGSFSIERTNVQATEIDTDADVINEGGSPVTDKGICYGIFPDPNIDLDIVISSGGGGLGPFSIPVSGLTHDTKYYFRAYATNTNGTGYSSQIILDTSYEPLVLEVTSTAVSELFSIIRAGSATADKPSYSVSAYIDWGDGDPIEFISSTTNTLATSGLDHVFAVPGTYVVRMSGECPRISKVSIVQGTSSVNLEEWGTQPWKVLYQAFYTCPNFEITATDAPVFAASFLNLTTSSGVDSMFRDSDFVGHASMNTWDLSGIERLTGMFKFCPNFNTDIGNWNVEDCITMNSLFWRATSFNQDIGSWDVGNVTDFDRTFACDLTPSSFDQNLDSWDVSSMLTAFNMFEGTNLTNSTLAAWTFDTSTFGYGNFSGMFKDTSHIPSGIGSWTFGISETNQTLEYMFEDTTGTIPDITGWTTFGIEKMNGMFRDTSFNQDISVWDVSNVDRMQYMFQDNTAINQDLSSWNIGGLLGTSALADFMDNVTTLSTANYDAILIGWESQSPYNANLANFGTTQYTKAPSPAATAHASLISTYGWTITDGGPTP